MFATRPLRWRSGLRVVVSAALVMGAAAVSLGMSGTAGVSLGMSTAEASPEIGVACAPSLSVSRTQGLAPEGEPVTISGTCFDVTKGIYVALCVTPLPGQVPNPCGGGMDLEGALGAAHWISSNPPPYAAGLTQPYGPGGSFTVQLRPAAALNDVVDCRRVQCAIVSRADHTRGSDRTQDVVVPVSFANPAPAPAPAPGPAPAPPPEPAPVPGPGDVSGLPSSDSVDWSALSALADAADPGQTPGPDSDSEAETEATTTTTVNVTTTTAPTGDDNAELASDATDGSALSPLVGFAIALVVVAAAGGVTIVMRRRAHTA
jgi:hypothetical protein